jgi:hypothetical protein
VVEPTTQAKKELEINPKKTLEQFWKEIFNELPGRFQILDKEKPTLFLTTQTILMPLKTYYWESNYSIIKNL